MNTKPCAVIADDEKQLRTYLISMLQDIWPELVVCGEAENGHTALQLIADHQADFAFLDIQMPGLSGLEVARQMPRSCRAVFVTAYDSYAVEAFESEAIDYLLKPVTPERLTNTVYRLKTRQRTDTPYREEYATIIEALLARSKPQTGGKYLKWIRVQHGDSVELIAVEDVTFFRAEDKYTCVHTANGESLIKTSIKSLTKELDPDLFWQVHRGTIVRVDQIAKVNRSLTGRFVITLKDRQEKLTVSRAHTHLFRQM